MFERYTEKARRVIFLARYEASQYGSPMIDTEHLLLGLLREDGHLAARFLSGPGAAAAIRAEIEKLVPLGERISTSVEMPLTQDGKRVLNVAAEEADRLGHKRIETEHLFLAMLRVQGSMAAQILAQKGAKLEEVRQQVSRQVAEKRTSAGASDQKAKQEVVRRFLAALKECTAGELSLFFAKDAQIVDWQGNLWQGLGEIDLEAFFAPYAKKNAWAKLDTSTWGAADSLVVNILWRNVFVPRMSTPATHRMTIIFAREAKSGLTIFFLQVTPIAGT